jgi:hypothetical protein
MAVSEKTKWQPINTAPYDETVFLGWDGHECGFYYRTDDVPNDGALSYPTPMQCYPTHWMPLPEPPQ